MVIFHSYVNVYQGVHFLLGRSSRISRHFFLVMSIYRHGHNMSQHRCNTSPVIDVGLDPTNRGFIRCKMYFGLPNSNPFELFLLCICVSIFSLHNLWIYSILWIFYGYSVMDYWIFHGSSISTICNLYP